MQISRSPVLLTAFCIPLRWTTKMWGSFVFKEAVKHTSQLLLSIFRLLVHATLKAGN